MKHTSNIAASMCLFILLLVICSSMSAQGGPPLLTDDPETPGNRQWEINTGVTFKLQGDSKDFDLPSLDLNYGWGDHLQLKFEIPWLVGSDGTGIKAEPGDGKIGVKWRFAVQENHGLNISTYPQFSWNSPGAKR